MKEVLARIQDGTFAREWIAENRNGGKNFAALREKERTHQIEEVGARLRSMMSWLPKEAKKAPKAAEQAQVVNA
jgi:ketol-acid reductoisomerase